MRNKLAFYLKIFSPFKADLLVNKWIPISLILVISFILMIYYIPSDYSVETKNLLLHNTGILNLHRSNDQNTEALSEDSRALQESIASEILRFHVIANSDSTEDQALKLIVKDALTQTLRPSLEKAKDISEARNLLKDSLEELEDISNDIIKGYGFAYTASASLERGYFPLKVYGDLSLPPGEYEAIRIELGSAKGQNWWCIMFPPLCFVDSTYSVVPDSSKEELKSLLTEEEYDAIFSKEKVNIKVSFKLLSWLEDFFSKDE
ncbi:MAG: stage sporulation protein [Lachnospiraceae bacterium]|nr:stage sporulation protein [Lachnospiraceae bacterium]